MITLNYKSGKMKIVTIYKLIFTTSLLFVSLIMSAAPSAPSPMLDWMMDNLVLVIGLVVIGAVLLSVLSTMNTMFDHKQREILASKGIEFQEPEPDKPMFQNVWKKLAGLRPIEKEVDIDMGHDYDGIRELDNKLPPWWLYLFYLTIVWAAVYLYIYQFSDIGQSSHEEYAAEMEVAKRQRVDYLYRMANSVNENNVVMLSDVADLEAGKDIFVRNCAACHGMEGEGGVGPNMTDDYYIHGGAIQDVFSTIKYGVPEKGMISWQSQINPSSMQQVASYIMTLPGTNPPNQKKPEGTLYEPSEETSN